MTVSRSYYASPASLISRLKDAILSEQRRLREQARMATRRAAARSAAPSGRASADRLIVYRDARRKPVFFLFFLSPSVCGSYRTS